MRDKKVFCFMEIAVHAIVSATLGCLLVLASFQDVLAQQAPGKAGPSQVTAGRKNPVDRVEARIVQLHEKLKIAPAQESAWNDFTQMMRDNAQAMKAQIDQRARQIKSIDAVSELRSHAEMAELYATGMRKLVPVFETLYNSMPDDQKKIADKVMTYREGRRRPRGK